MKTKAPPSPKARAKVRTQAQQQRLDRVLPAITVLVFFGTWELISELALVNPLFISRPTAIAVRFWDLVSTGVLFGHLWVSGVELFVGFGLAVAVAIPFGVAFGWYRTFRVAVDPFMSALYATPTIALLPLLIIFFGIGMSSKIAVVLLSAFFPIAINTAQGIRAVDPLLLKAARAFGATNGQIFRTVGIPFAVPYIIAGLRLGIGRGLIGVVVGELFAATAGVGYLLVRSGQTLQMDTFFVAVATIALSGYGLTEVLKAVERRLAKGRPDWSQ